MTSKRAAEIVRKCKVEEGGLDSTYCETLDFPHEWCYSCVNDLLEHIAQVIEKEK